MQKAKQHQQQSDQDEPLMHVTENCTQCDFSWNAKDVLQFFILLFSTAAEKAVECIHQVIWYTHFFHSLHVEFGLCKWYS